MRVATANFMRCWMISLLTITVTAAFSQTVNISPKNLYFGRIPEGKKAQRDILIYNIGTKTLNISKLRIEGTDAALFKMAPDPGSVSLGIAQKLVLPIEFLPAMDGSYSAKLIVESNAASSPDIADLSGISTDLDKGIITFERIFGSPDGDGTGSVRETADGGFIIAGSMVRLNEDYSDATLTKTDKYGQLEWRRWYGEEDWSEGLGAAIVTPDGGYIAVGSHKHSAQLGQPDIYVVKTDASGNLVWQKSYFQSVFKADESSDIIATADGGYIIAGDTQKEQDKDAYLIKIDADGKVLWEKLYGGIGGEDIAAIKPSGDGGYVFVGSSSTYSTSGPSDYDFYLVKVDASGNQVWQKSYGGTDWDKAGGFTMTGDGGYLLAGYTASPEFGAVARDAYLIKLDAAGSIEWQKLYGWEHKDGATEVITTDDGGYLFVGSSERYYDTAFEVWRSDIYVVKTDGGGVEQWSKTFGDVQEESAAFVRQCSDGGYIISGRTSSYSKDNDIYLIKLGRDGKFTAVQQPVTELPKEFALEQNYPNPFNAVTSIQYHLPYTGNVELAVFNIQGQQVCTLINGVQQAGSYLIRWNADDLAGGFYFYRLHTEGLVQTRRMLLLK
ncbi:T9SS type A sorting domain-containing protein [candidate division KSB1 bacterium]|nr:T9SS type A sorting domain-containing protein [candidate division KSB1 bacterium]